MSKQIILRRREYTLKNNFIESVAWKVPVSKMYPEGVKYTFTFIEKNKRIIAIDNYNYESHHIHYYKSKIPFTFRGLIQTEKLFLKLVEDYENDKNKRNKDLY
tara:strand:+ start:727 stop:1035 length:309 start_codon:yes stop_codon:yes gene_type:complete